MTSSHPPRTPCQWFPRLASALDRRSAPRLALLFLGAVLARGRRTVTSWIRAAGLSDQFRLCYTAVAAAGKKAERISLAKRAGQRRGWTTEAFTLYGEPVTKRYKTFLATWKPPGGVIRVVLVDEPTGWRAYFCTDSSASVADILTTVANRFSLEVAFRD
jgi:hypothetical protein